MPNEDLSQFRPADLLRDKGQDYAGVTRVLSSQAGTPGDEREYEPGDEVLVEAGLAEWVVAPVFAPSAGRQLDGAGSAERGANPLGGVEGFPVAHPTTHARRSEARAVGFAEAHRDESVEEQLAAKRRAVARGLAEADGDDIRQQSSLGNLGARSGPVTSQSDLPADKALAAASAATSTPEESKAAQGDARTDPRAALRSDKK